MAPGGGALASDGGGAAVGASIGPSFPALEQPSEQVLARSLVCLDAGGASCSSAPSFDLAERAADSAGQEARPASGVRAPSDSLDSRAEVAIINGR